ncbi:acyltransferase [Aliivibrio sp. S2TY2]|uniref:acyltransferase family protein n=1 Tax=unclassified Aliivibrio TaxID=2645654 RepID=UPI0023786960|nr:MULTISPECIES: acyltransferase [unclassified Aliivibrio]MDD9175000.1 acyltransferase [Aliivibrio sp. S3TY1]MDD9192053.1 acyltransferase [Aliivibrio sp. S2TY2]
MKKNFLKNMNYLRGFAILNIMIVHIWYIPELTVPDGSIYPEIINGIRAVLFHDSTIYFVFISGFFLRYLSHKLTPYQYYLSKFKSILLPYVFFSTLVYILYAVIGKGDLSSIEYLKLIIMGKAQVPYWYIPFITIVFIISPLLLTLRNETLKKILPILLFLPLLGTRTGTNISLGQYVFFVPIYIFGMIAASNYDSFIKWVEKNIYLLFLATFISTILIILSKTIDFKFIFFNFYESSHYIQKMALLCIMVLGFKKIEHLNIKVLNLFAKYSFSLFFTHTIVNLVLLKISSDGLYILFHTSKLLIIPISIIYTLISIFLSLLFCIIAKKILGRYSRYIIGV